MIEQLEDRRLLANDAFPATQATLTLTFGDPVTGPTEIVDLTGPTTVMRDDVPGDNVGPNGLEDVGLQVDSMDLFGDGPQIGPVSLQLNPAMPSVGFAEEGINLIPQELEPPITSVLDMFVEVNAPFQGFIGVNQQPITLVADLSQVPPALGEVYQFNGQVELFDAGTGQPFDPRIFVTQVSHTVLPGIVEHDIFPRTVGQVVIELPDGSTELITTAGPSAVDVFFEGFVEGDANDNDGNNLDEVTTQLVQADFDGFHPLLGPVQIRLSDDQPSLGVIEEQVNNTPGLLDVDPFAPGNADSFFDVFFEITLPATGQTLVTAGPTRVQTVIDDKPPQDGERYIFEPPQPVELIDKVTGLGTGIFIVREIHDEDPTVEHDIFPRTVGQVVIELPDGSTELVTTAGPSQVDVYFEGPAEGDASDDDGDGLDEVVSELVQADFDGFHPLLGPVQIRLRDDLPSLGQITEQVNNTPGLLDIDPFAPGAADSFFDVFFEITLPATGQTLVTAAPTRVQTVIENKPPEDGERYIFNPPQPVELIDSVTGLGTGIFIVREIHDENPTVEHDIFVESVVEMVLIQPDSSTETLQLTGPAMVDVYFEGALEGDASDDDGNGLDEVVAEMVQLDLTGASSLGPVIVRLDPNQPTLGRIEELNNNNPGLLDVDPFAPGNADSFFDVFFEIEIGGQVFHPATAKRVQTVITNKPPAADDVYVGVDIIDLLDENGQPTGFAIGTVRHAPTAVDYGDAPDAAGGPATGNPYPTLLEHDGARHVIVAGAPFLGVVPPDPEVDGQPTASADGDDTDGNDDEDGLNSVTGDLSGAGQVLPGESFKADVTVNGTGLFSAWVDWNRNGSWNDAGEQLAADVPFATGPGGALLALNGIAPAAAVAGDSYIRLRVSNDAGLLPTGLASDGEVEDFEFTILSGMGCSLLVNQTGDSGSGSLRDAIICANVNAGLNTIRFDIGGAGPHTIAPLSPLPTITDAVVIDGTTEPDFAGTPVVELSGTSAAGAIGLLVKAGPSRIEGLVINDWDATGIQLGSSDGHTIDGNYIGTDVVGTVAVPNGIGIKLSKSSNNTIGTGAGGGNLISGNTAAGIRISGTASTGNNIWNNLIGTDASGMTAIANGSGVEIVAGQTNTVGGDVGPQGNTISGNVSIGVMLQGDNNSVEGNRIGTSVDGDAAVPNTDGVLISASSGNVIGGTADGAGNQISGNSGAGVLLSGVRATGNFVQGNLIGTDASGIVAIANRQGVSLAGAPTNTIGGTISGAGNTISGNSQSGIEINGSDASGNRVEGNQIGTNLAGDAPIANQFGVNILDAPDNIIGGTDADAGNVISGNSSHGVRLRESGATGNLVQGNSIGTDASGTISIPNADGVLVARDATGNTIGGTAPGAANEIAGNNGRGVFVTLNAGTGNAVTQNSIHNNAGLGIELAGKGRTANDPGDPDAGGNNVQNFPVISSVVLNAGNLDIEYSVDSTTTNSAYPLTIEVFVADSDFEEGETFLGSAQYTAAVAGGTAIGSIPAGAAGVGTIIVATATDDDANTSEFSDPAIVTAMLLAAGGAVEDSTAPALTPAELAPIVDAAVERLAAAGLNADLLTLVDVAIADLPGAALGQATSASIAIDVNAAGHGWFVDATPYDDVEFSNPHSEIQNPKFFDLLTVVMHELGHVAGLEDLADADVEDDLMYGWLAEGVRKTSLAAALADAAFAGE